MQNIIEQIDQVAKTYPDRICYDYLGSTHTYQELKTKSDALSNYLKQTLPKEGPVIVYGGQKFDVLVTFLAVVKAGHAYIPVDVNSSLDRLKVIAEIAKPAACLALETLPEIDLDLLVMEQAALKAQMNNTTAVADVSTYVSNQDIFYIIFTSGTTGQPKGVQISHDNLLSFITWMNQTFPKAFSQTSLSQAPYSFDLSVMDLYPTLVNGGKLAVLPKDVTANFKDLFSWLPQLKLNTWVSTPSFADVCLINPDFNAQKLPDLNYFLFCGEELTHATAQKLKTRFPSAKIYNTYGPTEATVAVTQVEITQDILDAYPRLPIGICKDDAQIVLLDDDGKDVALGQTGEIVIVGGGVSKGYLNNPLKTRQAFLTYQGRPAYKTGDLGRFDAKGQLLYAGRKDFQIKLHGYRIELEDVDQCLSRVSFVNKAAAVPKYDQNHKVSQLIAYVKAENHHFTSNFQLTQAIKQELKAVMMPYMMPNRFVYVDELPLTPNGKVNRKLLLKEVNGDA